LNLNSPSFVKAVAGDERSYKMEYFSKAASILLRHGLKHQDDITKLEQFVNQVELAKKEGQEEEEELGEVPDEFLGELHYIEMSLHIMQTNAYQCLTLSQIPYSSHSWKILSFFPLPTRQSIAQLYVNISWVIHAIHLIERL
jgi:hypothetical protein